MHVHDNTIISTGGGPTALGWFEDWDGSLYADISGNGGSRNAYWFPDREGSYDRYEYEGPIETLSAFNRTSGEEAGRYLSNSEKDRILSSLRIPPR